MSKNQQAIDAIIHQGMLPLYFNADESVSIEILRSIYKAGVKAVEYTNRGEAALKNFKAMVAIRNAEMPSDTSSIAQLIQEMVDQQRSKVLKVARELVADATPEDIRNPQDFPELSTDALFNYEDGILTGYLSMQTALRSQEKNESKGLE